MDTTRLREVWQRLHEFCSARDWRGYDPYDGLNSRLFQATPLADGKFFRQAWTQFHRRSPINFRPLCGIEPTLNPKAVALFAMGSGDLKLLDLLEQLRTQDGGWGYPFDWQSRAFFAPRGTPNLICTAFAARAFRELGRACDVSFIEKHLLLRARRGALDHLHRRLGHTGAQRQYDRRGAAGPTRLHGVFGAAAAARRFVVVRRSGEPALDRQFPHGLLSGGAEGVRGRQRETRRFAESAGRGFEYWDKTFWHDDGAPRYYHDETYPLDCHCSAQGILTYLAFGNLTKANFVARWALQNMWDERGFFWYQRGRRSANRICYMRWTQAWMYCALAKLIKANETAHR